MPYIFEDIATPPPGPAPVAGRFVFEDEKPVNPPSSPEVNEPSFLRDVVGKTAADIGSGFVDTGRKIAAMDNPLETAKQTATGLVTGAVGFADDIYTRVMTAAHQLAMDGKIDPEAVKIAGEQRAKLYAFEPTDPGAQLSLDFMASIPTGIKQVFQAPTQLFDKGKHPNLYASLMTIGDLAELAAFGKVFETLKLKSPELEQAAAKWPGLDATFAKDQVRTETALERTRGGEKPLSILAKKEAGIKGDIPLEGERAIRSDQLDRAFNEIPSQQDIVRRNIKPHEAEPVVIEAPPVKDPRFIEVSKESLDKPLIEVQPVPQGRRVKLPEDIAREQAEAPPPEPVQERLKTSAEMNEEAFFNKRPITMFPKKAQQESRVATLRGKIKELGGIQSRTFRERVGQTGMRNVPNETERLLRTAGRPHDLLERDLKEEGWLYPDESLVDLLQQPENLRRGRILRDPFENKLDRHMTAQEKQFLQDLKWEPEEPAGFENLPAEVQAQVATGKLSITEAKRSSGKLDPVDELTAFFEEKKQETRSAWDTVQDLNTLMGDRGSISFDKSKFTPEQTAALERLGKDIESIRRKADEAGKTMRRYLTDMKVDPKVALKLSKHADEIQKIVYVERFKTEPGNPDPSVAYKRVVDLKPTEIENKIITHEQAFKDYKAIKSAVNSRDGKEIFFVNQIFGKLARHKGNELIFKTIRHFPDLIQKAEPIYYELERNPQKHVNISGYQNYLSKVRLSGDEYWVRFTVQDVKKPGGNELHSAFVSDVEITKAEFGGDPSGVSKPTMGARSSLVDHKLKHWLSYVKKEYETVQSASRSIKDILSDLNTLLGEKGSLNLSEIKNLSPEQQAAYLRVNKDIAALRRNAERVGQDFKDYLINMKVPPDIAEMMARKAEDLPKYAKSVNLEKQDIPTDLKQFEADIAAQSGPRKVQSWDETGKLSANLRGDYKRMARVIERAGSGEALTAVEIDAARQVNVNAMDTLKKMSTELSPEEFSKRYMEFKENVFNAVSAASSEAGRALNIHKREISIERMARAFDKLKRSLNERELKEFQELNFDDPIAVQRFMDRLGDPAFKDYLLEYWYNQILSGPPTHLVNTISNTAWLAWQVPHRALTALVDLPISKLTGRERTRFINEIVPMLAGYKSGFKRGARAAGQMIRHNRVTDFETKWTQEMGHAQGAFERSPNKVLRKAAPYITMPTRFLRAMDVWANSIAYDAHANTLARRAANQKKLTGKARAEFERKFVEKLSDADHEACMEQARYSTFMDNPDPFTQWIMNSRKIPFIGPSSQFIVPFVSTISNLTKRGLEMTPALGLVKEGGSRAMGRGHAAPEVIAKQIEGAVIALYTFYKISEGEITGPLPETPNEREAFYREGKLPWAIKIGDTYYQYRRIEPFNTVIASVVIAHDAIKNAKDDESAAQIFLNVAHGIKGNLIDSSYLQGVQQILDPQGSAKGMVPRLAASWVPYSSFWRSINRTYEVATEGTTKVREGNEWLKAFSQVIPGLSDKMPAKLDLWGNETVIPGGVFRQWLPYKWSVETNDPVEQELERLEKYPGKPGQRVTVRGEKIKLAEDVYRDHCLYFGKTAKAMLAQAMASPGYASRPDDQKLQILDKRINVARRKAEVRVKRRLRGTS